MHRRTFLALFAAACLACGDNGTAPPSIDGRYVLTAENDEPLPADPGAPGGCCLTLGGALTLASGAYELRHTYRNKNTAIEFDNIEQGRFTRSGSTLDFTRTGGGGLAQPFLLAPGTVSGDERMITLRYGDEGPGSNQIRGTYQR